MKTTFIVCVLSWMAQIGETDGSAYHDDVTFHIPGFYNDITGDDVTVSTNSGKIRGKRRLGDVRAGGATTTVDWFLGIPFAKPPIGDRRFRRPASPDPWSPLIRDAFRFGHACPQMDGDYLWFATATLQDEDCLFLNVYSPFQTEWNEGEKEEEEDVGYPVMVYFHGGSYKVGTANVYHSQLLAQHGVVVVTVNYRLGILGFLSSRDAELKGNYGLLDQIKALKWVQQNIRSFRGNPGQVTVFGNSAGGASVGLLSVSPLAKGLFSKAIIQSGSPLAFWSVHNQTADLVSYVRSLAAELSCSRQHMPDLVACLRTVDWRKFVWTDDGGRDLEDILPRVSAMGIDVKPVIDGYVIPDSPLKLMQQGLIVPQTVLAGIVEDEWSKLYTLFLQDLPDSRPYFDDNRDWSREDFDRLLRHVMCARFGYDEIVYEMVRQEYTNWDGPADDRQNKPQYLKFGSDLVFLAPTILLADVLHERIPTFVYLFNHQQHQHDHRQNTSSGDPRENYHQMELNYLFGSPFTGTSVFSLDQSVKENYSDQEREASRLMMELWSNFASSGDPVKRSNWSIPWEVYNSSTSPYLEIGNGTMRPMRHLRSGKMRFWNHVIPATLDRLQRCRGATGSANSGERRYSDGFWILLSCAIFHSILLVALLVFALRRDGQRQQNKS